MRKLVDRVMLLSKVSKIIGKSYAAWKNSMFLTDDLVA